MSTLVPIPPPRVTWVLLRGLSRANGEWGKFPHVFLEQMDELQPGARLLLLDLPGHGERSQQPSPSSVTELMESCREELRARQIEGPVHLLAMSLGALVASEWVTRYSDEISAAVLINTCLRPINSFFLWHQRPASYLRLFGAARREPADLAWAPTSDLPTELGPAPASSGKRLAYANAWRQMLAALRYRASRAQPKAPMLLLCSMSDGLVDWRCSRAISRAWGVPLRLHTAAGHDLPREDPPWVATAVTQWLHAQAQARSGLPRAEA